MQRFLFAVWSLESHVHPNLAVAGALRDRGHEVAFYAGPRAAKICEENGFTVFPFHALREDVADLQFAALLEDQGNARRLAQTFSDVLLSQIGSQIKDLGERIDAWQPHALVTDMAMLGPFAVLNETKKLPVAVLSHVGYCMVPGPQGPVPGRALPPRTSLVSRVQAALIHRAADWMTRHVPREVDRIRKRHALAPTGLRVTQLHGRADLLLIPSLPELDFNRTDLPASVRYVGACVWPALSPWPATTSATSGLIAVEEGGYYKKEPFLIRRALAAFGGAKWNVHLLPGPDRDLRTFGALPANVCLEESKEKPDVVVTTGNTESILRALSHGIPLVVVPSMLDQAEMALRVERFGSGVYLKERQCTPEHLAKAVNRVMQDARFKQKAAESAALLAKHSGPLEASEALEQIVSR